MSDVSLVPPHDLTAESAVLRACMVYDDAFDQSADVLHAEAFYSEAYRRVYEAIAHLRLDLQPTDTVSVGTRLRESGRLQQVGGQASLTDILANAPAVGNVRAHALTIVRLWKARQIIFEAQRTVAQGLAALGDPEEFVTRAAEAMHAIAHSSAATTIEPIAHALKERMIEITRAEHTGVSVGIPSGFACVDRLTGGLHRGDLTILAARPGVGKSALALAIADAVSTAGHAVAFFSLEMVKAQLVDRLLCMGARADVALMRIGKLSSSEWSRVTTESLRVNKLPLWIDDRPGVTALEVAAKSRRVQAEESKRGRRLGLIVVDYLQLMRSSAHARKMNSREREVSETAEYLKALAASLDVPVLALSQLNRQSEQGDGRKPRLSDLRESGALEQHANNVMFIHRAREQDDATAELILAKQRNGPTGVSTIRFEARFTRFSDMPEGYGHEYAAQ